MKQIIGGRAFWCGLVLAVGAGSTFAQCPELSLLLPSDRNGGEQAGFDVALKGDLAVLGAPYEYNTDWYQGAVYVYRFDGTTWNEEAKLIASDGVAYDYYGASVATDGTRIAVGSPNSDVAATDSGAVYVYVWNGASWNLEKKLSASTGAASDYFGTDVAISNKMLLVGTPNDDIGGYDQGSVFSFRRDALFGWTEDQQLILSSPANYDTFGACLVLDGTTALIGAPQRDPIAYNSGAAYVFRDNGSQWVEGEALVPSDGAYNDWFGCSVGLGGGVAVVGAKYKDGTFADQGGAYVFALNGGTYQEQSILTHPSPMASSWFGHAVDTDGSTVLVGAPYHSNPLSYAGAMYSFVSFKGNWAYDQPFLRAAAGSSEYCGFSVAVDGNRGLAGIRYLDAAYYDTGGAGVFSVNEFVMDASPSTVSAGDTLTFDMYCGTPQSPCMFCVVDVSGVPFFYAVFKPLFAANHHVTLATPVPPGLAGIDIGFMAFRFNAFNRIQGSNSARVYFQ